MLSKRHIVNALGPIDGINLKLLACVEEDGKDTEGAMRILMLMLSLLIQLYLLRKLRVLR